MNNNTIRLKMIEIIRKWIEFLRGLRPIRDLAEAMAVFEGFYSSDNTLAQRNHNPLNLRYSKFQVDNRGGFAVFRNDEQGWEAGIWDLSAKCSGNTVTGLSSKSTLKELIYVWAPPSDNNHTDNYVGYVARRLKVKPSFKLKNFII